MRHYVVVGNQTDAVCDLGQHEPFESFESFEDLRPARGRALQDAMH